MKISAAQKDQNRRALLRAAVKLIAEQGFDETSLREISATAGLSDPVVYKYFPNKQSLLYEYLRNSVSEAVATVTEIPAIEALPFAEQAQLLIETHLDVLARDQAFIKKIYPIVFVNGLGPAQEALAPCRSLFASFIDQCLGEAIRVGEFPAPPFRETIVAIFWDFHVGLLSYSLNDKSELKANTSELMQKSLAIVEDILKSGLLTRLSDMAYFLIRTHLLTPSLNARPVKVVKKARPQAWSREA